MAPDLTPLFSRHSSCLRFFSSKSLSLVGDSEPQLWVPRWLWESSQSAVKLLWEGDVELEQDG